MYINNGYGYVNLSIDVIHISIMYNTNIHIHLYIMILPDITLITILYALWTLLISITDLVVQLIWNLITSYLVQDTLASVASYYVYMFLRSGLLCYLADYQCVAKRSILSSINTTICLQYCMYYTVYLSRYIRNSFNENIKQTYRKKRIVMIRRVGLIMFTHWLLHILFMLETLTRCYYKVYIVIHIGTCGITIHVLTGFYNV